jgi:hypothetical protein
MRSEMKFMRNEKKSLRTGVISFYAGSVPGDAKGIIEMLQGIAMDLLVDRFLAIAAGWLQFHSAQPTFGRRNHNSVSRLIWESHSSGVSVSGSYQSAFARAQAR